MEEPDWYAIRPRGNSLARRLSSNYLGFTSHNRTGDHGDVWVSSQWPSRGICSTYQTSGGASLLPPPYQSNIVDSGDPAMHNSAHDVERRALLSQPKRDSVPPTACVSLSVIFLILFLLCPTYFLYSSNLYKEMYEGVRVRVQHLEQENAALERKPMTCRPNCMS